MKNNELRFTLIADGSSDKVLLHVIKWLLNDLFPQTPMRGQFADFHLLRPRPSTGDLTTMIRSAEYYYPFDILFVHRDAEENNEKMIQQRIKEIRAKVQPEKQDITVCIVPVKMMETWLLIDSNAIKKAAGNRNYSGELKLPKIRQLEREPQPKQILHRLLTEVSGKRGRRLNVHEAVHSVAENIDDFSPLRALSAFQNFERQVSESVNNIIKTFF